MSTSLRAYAMDASLRVTLSTGVRGAVAARVQRPKRSSGTFFEYSFDVRPVLPWHIIDLSMRERHPFSRSQLS
jgi:hypothetical protein